MSFNQKCLSITPVSSLFAVNIYIKLHKKANSQQNENEDKDSKNPVQLMRESFYIILYESI